MGSAGGNDADHLGSATREWQAAELEALYQAAPVALAVIDREHRLVRINERMAAITGQSATDSIGRRSDEAAPEVAGQIKPLIERVFATGEPVREAEIRGRTPGSLSAGIPQRMRRGSTSTAGCRCWRARTHCWPRPAGAAPICVPSPWRSWRHTVSARS